MTRVLRITFHGDAPGVRDGGLSLDAFSEPMRLLLTAFRGVASQLQTAAADSEGAATGRFTKHAEKLDLQIRTIDHNCVAVALKPAWLDPQEALFPEPIVERSLDELALSVQDEAAGRPRNVRVRKFLASLPARLERHVWRLEANDGKVLREFTVGSMTLPETDISGDIGMTTVECRVGGVDFEPNARVRLRMAGKTHTVDADDVLVRKAIDLHGQDVWAKILTESGQPKRLLWLRSEPATERPSFDELARRLGERYSPVLDKLAQ